MAVLDAGCGTGAITAGIARAVGPCGRVIGIDRDERLLEIARKEHGSQENLNFVLKDISDLDFARVFDIVTAARTLQWIAEPESAISALSAAAKSGGLVILLDYNHVQNSWVPEPPSAFRRFYEAFLSWRERNGWQNNIADRLPKMLARSGVSQVVVLEQDEVAVRGDEMFATASNLWLEVIDNVRRQLVEARFCSDSDLDAAKQEFGSWIECGLQVQTLCLRAIKGVVC
jgi:SAM-dependent methyltransferase